MVVERNIGNRSFNFAVEVLKLVKSLDDVSYSRIIAYQVTKSATSIGANIEEAQAAESKADFIHKYNIALKEVRETRYWLKLLKAAKIITGQGVDRLNQESEEPIEVVLTQTENNFQFAPEPEEPEPDTDTLKALHKAGIYGAKANELALLEHVTPQYVQEMAAAHSPARGP